MHDEVIGIVICTRSLSCDPNWLRFVARIKGSLDTLKAESCQWTGMVDVRLTSPQEKSLSVRQLISQLTQRATIHAPSSKIGLKPNRVPVRIAGLQVVIEGDIILGVSDIETSSDPGEELRRYRDERKEGIRMEPRVLRGGRVFMRSRAF